MVKSIVIIGNGISGITCARTIRKQNTDVKITVISGESKYFFSRTALMYVFMGHMKFNDTQPYQNDFWEKNNLQLIQQWVTSINPEKKEILLNNQSKLAYDVLVIATGSVPRMLNWPGLPLKGVQGLYSKQDLELMFSNTQNINKAVVVGGGLIGVEMAEMLHSKNIDVTMVIREAHLWGNILPKEEAEIIENHLVKDYNIHLMKEDELHRIEGNKNQEVDYIVTKNNATIPCNFVGITIGVQPNIQFLKDSKIKTNKGVLINNFFETSCKEVYAIGDCAEFETPLPNRASIEQVWYTGRIMGETLGNNLANNKKNPYQPSPWFNSAKFFDIEYQTYGNVSQSPKCGEQHFVWKQRQRLLRFVFNENTQTLLGINAIGVRLRHPVIHGWLLQGQAIDDCIKHLEEINFDAEFSTPFVNDVIIAYNQQFNKSIPLVNKWEGKFFKWFK